MPKKLGITGFFKKNQDVSQAVDNNPDDSVIDHLWMAEDENKNKKKKNIVTKKDPRIDTGILRNRIADKIGKMNNHD